MKTSSYTVYHKQNGKYFVYHQITKTLMEVDYELAKALRSNKLTAIPTSVTALLKERGIIISDDFNESDPIVIANQKTRYGSDFIRVTILPTLNCNFRCWYCYESHKVSKMDKAAMNSVLKFIKNETIKKRKRSIILDWFGGEPLIYFDSIVFPFTIDLKKWSNENNINLACIMTSNGSLVTSERAKKMVEMGLSRLQITLDGGKESHNGTRYSNSLRNSYDKIIENIHTICSKGSGIQIDLRINYTPENIDSLPSILEDFAPSIRKYIQISPHIVWQKSTEMGVLSPKIRELKELSIRLGYSVAINVPICSVSCYTENLDQYVVNYDLAVYKCTARDFNVKNSIGRILPNGTFSPNGLYYKFASEQSPFINENCLNCDILPSCMYASSCLQKKIENSLPQCCKEDILNEIHASIQSLIEKSI